MSDIITTIFIIVYLLIRKVLCVLPDALKMCILPPAYESPVGGKATAGKGQGKY